MFENFNKNCQWEHYFSQQQCSECDKFTAVKILMLPLVLTSSRPHPLI